MKNIGLVLEGGGMRGVYTAGVLDLFMDKDIYFPYVIGVSAGACNAASYLSRQKGRSKEINIGFINDHRYLSFRNLLKERSIFGMKFMFDELPNRLVPFDYATYNKSETTFVIVATDCISGKPVYFYKKKGHDILNQLKASCSLPFLSPIITINGMKLLDGGISDSIPIKKAIEDGTKRNVIILTRNKGYRKKPTKGNFISRKIYKNYDCLIEAINNRYKVYNETLDYIEMLEANKQVFVIRPSELLNVGRLEKNKQKLEDLFNQGYSDAEKCCGELNEWLNAY
ncbi:MAG: patatin family protein [Clostridiaceae bacterium]|nr:patatin family protein [Clostridiaceae bacterium]